jgi:hypothetical protein
MPRLVSEIVVDIEKFRPSNGNWLPLDGLLTELFESGSPAQGVDAMLNIFERYPKEDGAGVFWAIVHGLESIQGYESKLIESLRKAPSEFALLMTNRLLNAESEGRIAPQVVSVLQQLAVDQTLDSGIRSEAQKIVNRHKA